MEFLTNIVFFFWGFIGIFGHILFKMKHLGIKRFSKVGGYIRNNQIQFAFTIFVYFIIYLLWNGEFLSKWMPNLWIFQSRITWLSPLVAYLSDSLFRNFIQDINSAVKRNK